jgi:phosphonate transport system ATP-binding protein
MLRPDNPRGSTPYRAVDAAVPVSPVITLDGVAKRFQSTTALSNISVTIPPGQFVAIIGRSGAGKTTLLHCLSHTTAVTEGSVRFGACDLVALQGESLRQHRARVGMIYQQFNLVKRLRVLDNVLGGRLPHLGGAAWWLALGRYFPAYDRDIALRCLDHVGMLSQAWQRTDTLSGGEQQRVAIAKVLAQEPQVILADELVSCRRCCRTSFPTSCYVSSLISAPPRSLAWSVAGGSVFTSGTPSALLTIVKPPR